MKKNTLNSNYDRNTTNKSYIHEEKGILKNHNFFNFNIF